jgi:uncharacterized RDD family membrane protein YckC
MLRANIDAPAVADVARPVVYAGFWRRVGAAIVDSILLTIISTLVGFVIGLVFGILGVSSSAASSIGGLIGFLIGLLYYPVLESSSAQATWGKRALNIIVTDTNGQRLSFWRALGRYLGKFISAVLLGFGFLMVAFTARKQGLHDMMASTLVVVRPS